MSNKNSLAVQIHDYSKGLDLNTTIWRYVSCWTTNSPTDMVMWRSYASALSSVAMRSSVGNLMNSLIDIPGQSSLGIWRYSIGD